MAAKKGGKLNKSEVIPVRFDPILKMAAELAAGKERRTMSSFVEMAVEQAVKQSIVARDEAGMPISAWQASYETWHEAPARRILNLALQFPDLLTIRERKILNAIRQLFGRELYESSFLPLFQLTGSELWNWLCRYADDEITFEALAEGTRDIQMKVASAIAPMNGSAYQL
ncbi:hypothetical protein [Candidatus Contendibacter odensensis]|uniref:Uncharacterized protein n=1 Tax=Candidatus Contendobacter odensis Run_B_J11 TaxID=1400861 RepID=A0A7U7J266_9GAMM|nr:hypothetical protein [Candidatus Contendobacter odensis]CDH43810.1 hypothetical protein BN874_1350008 [Candidatus Contendobacter odensis Run_B_J11]